MGLLRLSQGGRAWEQPRPEPVGPFWNPRKAVAQGVCSSQGPGRCVLLPVPISVSCHSPQPQMAAPAALGRTIESAPEMPRRPCRWVSLSRPKTRPHQQSSELPSDWPFLELKGFRRGQAPWPGSRDIGEAGDAGGEIWDFGDRQTVQILASPLTSCVTLGESFPSSALVSCLEHEDNITCPMVVFREFRETVYEKQVFTQSVLVSVPNRSMISNCSSNNNSSN